MTFNQNVITWSSSEDWVLKSLIILNPPIYYNQLRGHEWKFWKFNIYLPKEDSLKNAGD